MKLTNKSLTLFIFEVIAWFGNLPYSALSLFPKNYESLQDAVQKLIRAGYVAAIPTNPGKVLHITREGKSQLGRKLELYGEIPCFAEIQYDPQKSFKGRTNQREPNHVRVRGISKKRFTRRTGYVGISLKKKNTAEI